MNAHTEHPWYRRLVWWWRLRWVDPPLLCPSCDQPVMLRPMRSFDSGTWAFVCHRTRFCVDHGGVVASGRTLREAIDLARESLDGARERARARLFDEHPQDVPRPQERGR